MATYCGKGSCRLFECDYHVMNIDRPDVKHNYMNLEHTEYCLKEKTEEKKTTGE